MKETKLPEGCIDNSVSSSGGSFSLPDKPTNIPPEDCKEAIKKKLSFNRGAYSSPLSTDEPDTDLLEMEEKAEHGQEDAEKNPSEKNYGGTKQA